MAKQSSNKSNANNNPANPGDIPVSDGAPDDVLDAGASSTPVVPAATTEEVASAPAINSREVALITAAISPIPVVPTATTEDVATAPAINAREVALITAAINASGEARRKAPAPTVGLNETVPGGMYVMGDGTVVDANGLPAKDVPAHVKSLAANVRASRSDVQFEPEA